MTISFTDNPAIRIKGTLYDIDEFEITVALDGGWRVYSSGPGIALALLVTSLLGVRREGDALVIDPVIAPELSGLRAELSLLGRPITAETAQ